MIRERPHKYIPGDYLMVCDECGFVYRRSEMMKRWDNAWVCKNDYEPKHPQENIHIRPDRVRVDVSRPEADYTPGTTLTNTTTKDDL